MNSRDSTSVRDGYERTKFKHWTDEGKDGCSTHNTLLAEAATQPTIGAGCKTIGGAA
ncbi:hypothetical protein [Streptomyces lydicus]|uniref:hypothetical protein n=1 Tax=Streptomyces lydicus TaxID=47763 RepID=UPI0013E29923|nr:hypothetical protein [Streptomyces lydicus]